MNGTRQRLFTSNLDSRLPAVRILRMEGSKPPKQGLDKPLPPHSPTLTPPRFVQSASLPNFCLLTNPSPTLSSPHSPNFDNFHPSSRSKEWQPPSPARSRSTSPFKDYPSSPREISSSELDRNPPPGRDFEILTRSRKGSLNALDNHGSGGGDFIHRGLFDAPDEFGIHRSQPDISDDCSIHSAPEFESRTAEDKIEVNESDLLESDISRRTPPLPTRQEGVAGLQRLPFSLWDYLQEEVLAVEPDGEDGAKSERVTNFLTVPGEVEKVLTAYSEICSCPNFIVDIDHIVRFRHLPRLFPLHIHHSPTSYHYRIFSSSRQYPVQRILSSSSEIPPTFSQM